MILRLLDQNEMKMVYETYMTTDFPPDELKPFAAICCMVEAGHYLAYGMYAEDRLVGYAFLVYEKQGQTALVDYLAICADCRDMGCGGMLIEALRRELADWQGIILEVENPKYADNASELALRQRRIRFYRKNQVELSDVEVKMYGVQYQIMYFTDFPAGAADCRDSVEAIYHTMFPDQIYQKQVEFAQ